MISAALLFAVLGLLFVNFLLRRTWKDDLACIPGSILSKWTDIQVKYHWFAGDRAIFVDSLHQKYGQIVRLGPNEVDVCDVDSAKLIHRVGGGFVKSPWYQRLEATKGQNVFSICDVPFHSIRRRLLSSPISESALRQFEPLIAPLVRLAMGKMQREMEMRGAVDVFKWWMFMVADIMGGLTFGKPFGMLEAEKEAQFSQDLKDAGATWLIRAELPNLIRIARIFPLPIFLKELEAFQRAAGYAAQCVERYKAQIAINPNLRPTLFTKLFNAGKKGLSDQEIVDEAQIYNIAGTDTTANALTYLVWATCRDEDIKLKLAGELASLPEDFSDNNLRDLPYLNQVINETLRLYAPVPAALPRVVPSPGSAIAGYWIPGGAIVSTQAYSLHRNPGYFSEPEKFNPSRWAAPTQAMKDAFMPFGGGSRVCLGLHLARKQLRIATAYFFRTFPNAKVSTEGNMSDTDMDQVMYFINSPKGKRCLIEAS